MVAPCNFASTYSCWCVNSEFFGRFHQSRLQNIQQSFYLDWICQILVWCSIRNLIPSVWCSYLKIVVWLWLSVMTNLLTSIPCSIQQPYIAPYASSIAQPCSQVSEQLLSCNAITFLSVLGSSFKVEFLANLVKTLFLYEHLPMVGTSHCRILLSWFYQTSKKVMTE